MATDDEWESAEIQLKSLEIAAPIVVSSAAPSIALQASVPPSIAIVERRELIDDVLISALDNPRERLFVLQTEDLMLKYVKSSDRYIDLPPGYNSFRRLLTYRLAKRFGLNHTSSDHPIESDRIIRLTKTSTVCIPFPLLINHHRDIENSEEIIISKGGGTPVNEEASTPTADPPKKVMLMKRRTDGGPGGSNKSSSAKPQQTTEDREKAYKEARERIFGAEAAAAADASKDSVITPVGTSTQVSSASPSLPEATAAAVPLGKSTSGTAINERVALSCSPALREVSTNGGEKIKRSTSVSQLSTLPKKGPDTSSNSNVSGGKERRAVDTTSWREKKGQVRDVENERFDPDFNRGNSGRSRNNNRYYTNPAQEFDHQQQMQQQLPLAPSLGDYDPPVTSAYPAWGYGGSSYAPQTVQYDPYGQVMPPPPSLQTPSINNGDYYDAARQWIVSPEGQNVGYDPNYYVPQPRVGYYEQQQAYYGYSNPSPPQQYYQQQPSQQQPQQQYSRGSNRGNDPRNEQFPPLR